MSIIGHAADVVAPQVDEHDVLGPLLGIGQQLFGQGAVLGLVGTPAPRPRQRPDRHHPVLDPHQDLRRAADQGEIAIGQIKQKRAGIDHAQHPVNIERGGLRLDREPLAGNHLKNVAGLDVFLAMTHDRFIFGAGEIRPRLERDRRFRVDVAQSQLGAGRGQAIDQLVDPVARRFVGRPGIGVRPDMCLGDHQDRLADMIEEHHPVVKRKRKIGKSAIIGRHRRQILGVPDRIVRSITDRPPREPRQAPAVEPPDSVSTSSWRSRNGSGDVNRRAESGSTGPVIVTSLPARLEPQERLGSQEAEPPHLLAADHALKQKRGRGPLDPRQTPTRASSRRRSTGGRPECTTPSPASAQNSS